METKAQIISVRQHPDATRDQARDARARAWRFVIDAHEKKKAAGSEADPKPE